MTAGTLVSSISSGRDGVPTQVAELTWVSDGSGNVSVVTEGLYGVITRATFVPGTAALQPSDNYDVTILDEFGYDLLVTTGLNRSDTTTQSLVPAFGVAVAAGPLTLTVANAGAANSGTVILTLVRAGANHTQIINNTIEGDGLVHVTKTLTFTGAATLGLAASVITFFTNVGRNKVERLTVFCTADGVSAASGTMALGTADTVARFLAATLATNFDVGKYVVAATTALASAKDNLTTVSAGTGIDISSNIIGTVAVGDITAGTIVVDVWYRPITSDGQLVGD